MPTPRSSPATHPATELRSDDAAPSPGAAPPERIALPERRHELTPFALTGVICVIAGGLVAAVTAPAPTELGTWAAAYLVLVGGVAQVGLGLGQAVLTTRTATPVIAAQATGWNLGNAAVLVGTLLGVTALVDVGGGSLVVVLALFARGATPARARRAAGVATWCLQGYRLLLLVLLASIPVGLILARVHI